jgi:hypothetical protein
MDLFVLTTGDRGGGRRLAFRTMSSLPRGRGQLLDAPGCPVGMPEGAVAAPAPSGQCLLAHRRGRAARGLARRQGADGADAGGKQEFRNQGRRGRGYNRCA